MATTRKPQAQKPYTDPYLYPEPLADCLELVRALYSKYTGYQIASCIRVVRAEILAEKAQNEPKTE